MRIRFYIWPEQGEPQRLANAALDKKRFPQFANTRQRIVQAVFEGEGETIGLSARGLFFSFGADGFPASNVRDLKVAMAAHSELGQLLIGR